MICYLNTSYVKVQLKSIPYITRSDIYLNTSYVKVQHGLTSTDVITDSNLNTSYVKVQQLKLEQILGEGAIFKYILC